MKFKLKCRCILLLFICVSKFSFGQQSFPQVYPSPQHIRFKSNSSVNFKSLDVKDGVLTADIKALLGTIFPLNSGTEKLPLRVTKLETATGIAGAYTLDISSQGIDIGADDDKGVFYAIQTLIQLRGPAKTPGTKLPVVQISDYPDIAVRGTVEGFYGEPWSHADRLSQFLFYGQMKLNTYIYGPKDDPYHSSPNWRIPYPAKEAALIKDLVAQAGKNRVDFVWAIHPGKDIKWNKADSLAVLEKFDAMYQLGVRSFAVFFDDISGDGTDAKKQAGLLNYIQREFINKRKGIKELIMCPTEYNKGWANPKPGTYLDILGDELDPAVFVMWTGNTVIADNTREGLDWVNKRIKRPAFVWWNFPVSDYVRDHLLMGPSYGLEADVKNNMSGFVSNPMDKAEASKVALFGVADYAWNLKHYDYQASWEAANSWIMPEAPAAFRLFNSHNSDLGPNGHGYRRRESEEVKSVFSSFLADFKEGKYAAPAAHEISTEFSRIEAAAAEIQQKSLNKRLVEQINPWLQQFSFLGKAGTAAMKTVSDWNNQSYASAWKNYIDTEMYLDSMAHIDKTYNQNPYQPGIKTGSLLLTPFVKTVYERLGNLFANDGQDRSAEKNTAASTSQTALLTNSSKLKMQPIQLTNTTIAISPVLEVLKLNAGEYFGMRLSEGLQLTALEFNFESANLLNWGRFEVSADGLSWTPLAAEEKRGKGKVVKFEETTKYLRFVNTSDQTQSIFLKMFRLSVQPINGIVPSDYVFDGSIATYQNFSSDKELLVTLPTHLQKQSLVILLKGNNTPVKIYSKNKKGKRTKIYQGNQGYIPISQRLLKNVAELCFSTANIETIKIYEIKKLK